MGFHPPAGWSVAAAGSPSPPAVVRLQHTEALAKAGAFEGGSPELLVPPGSAPLPHLRRPWEAPPCVLGPRPRRAKGGPYSDRSCDVCPPGCLPRARPGSLHSLCVAGCEAEEAMPCGRREPGAGGGLAGFVRRGTSRKYLLAPQARPVLCRSG